ncbi:type II toxin-antitoxin system ParD family antitoxin [uncultured Arcticibacterium sp.]|uniref:type II toxin-antitoxin system ParD family antitoxin n=1 Tax=uncultured Arcticibacterium sp. TaxID=2173042 RepID=UPI0030FBE2BD
MGKNTSVLLGQYFQDFIAEEVASGRYNSASEVVRDALRGLDRERKGKQKLFELLEEADNGEFTEFDSEEFKKRMHEKYVAVDAEN